MADGIKKINENVIKDFRTINITQELDAYKVPIGTNCIDAINGGLKYCGLDNNNNHIWKHYLPSNLFDKETITEALIANNSITANKIKESAIKGKHIEAESLLNQNFKDNTIAGDKLQNNSIDISKLKDNCFSDLNAHISGLNGDSLAINSLSGDRLKNNSIPRGKIAFGSITCSEIANKSIANENLQDYCLTSRNFRTRQIEGAHINYATIKGENIVNGTIEGKHIANRTISGNNIQFNSIPGGCIIDDSIDGAKISPHTITSRAIREGTIDTVYITDGAITKDKLELELRNSLDSFLNKSIGVVKLKNCYGTEVSYNSVYNAKGNMVVTGSIGIGGNANVTGSVIANKCYNPVFADIAETYIPTEEMEPGDAVCLSLDGGLKVEKLNKNNSDRFIGFVSDEYAILCGGNEEDIISKKKVAVTLVGRIKIKLPFRDAKLGRYISIKNGKIKISEKRTVNSIGRILENKAFEDKYVLCQLWP